MPDSFYVTHVLPPLGRASTLAEAFALIAEDLGKTPGDEPLQGEYSFNFLDDRVRITVSIDPN